MELLDKLMAAFKPKQEAPVETPTEAAPEAPQEAATPAVEEAAPVVEEAPVEAPQETTAASAEMIQTVESFVYDPELAASLAPVFVAMSAVEGFDKVMELFAAKEKQIKALNVGATEQQSKPAPKQEVQVAKPKSATEILKERNQPKSK